MCVCVCHVHVLCENYSSPSYLAAVSVWCHIHTVVHIVKGYIVCFNSFNLLCDTQSTLCGLATAYQCANASKNWSLRVSFNQGPSKLALVRYPYTWKLPWYLWHWEETLSVSTVFTPTHYRPHPLTTDSSHSLLTPPIHYWLHPLTANSSHSLLTPPTHYWLHPLTTNSSHSLLTLSTHYWLLPITIDSSHSGCPVRDCDVCWQTKEEKISKVCVCVCWVM